MDKNSVEKFQGEGHPVWFLGSWSDMPVKAKVIKICRDERAGEYAEVDCIHDDECYAFGSHSVHFDNLYPSKTTLLHNPTTTAYGTCLTTPYHVQRNTQTGQPAGPYSRLQRNAGGWILNNNLIFAGSGRW